MALGNFSQQFSDEVNLRLNSQLRQRAQTVVQIAESLAPKRTGRLATSISFVQDEANLTVEFIVAAPYGIFVEYGTRHNAPHPYLRPAINYVFSGDYGRMGDYGYEANMTFANVIQTDKKLLARGGGFVAHKSLTAAQHRHIQERLVPTSRRYNVGAVSRSKLRVRHAFP